MRKVAKGMILSLAVGLAGLGVELFSHDESVPKDILTKKNPVASSDAVLTKAKSNYEENCLMCHGEAGKGDGPMAGMLKERPPDLTDTKMMAEMTDGQIFWQITKGVKPMPSFENKISEEERWGLVHLMRSLSKTKPNTTPHKH